MARISIVQCGDGPKLFYNVHATVGPGATNRRDDVLLVQYFIREIFRGLPSFKSDPFQGGTLAVDGVAGKQTFAAILHVQMVQKKLGANIPIDGRIDPPTNEQLLSTVMHNQYTIIYLNKGFKRARVNDWPRVSQASDCPAELRQWISEPEFV